MANTLTGLIPTLYGALDVVSRELVGFIPAVTRNSSAERAALNETITYHVAPAASTSNITPGVTAPNDGDQTLGTDSLTISKSKYAPIRWNGEEMKIMQNLTDAPINDGSEYASGFAKVVRDQFAQAMRALVNEVEADIAGLYVGASRAYGTAGTAPFGTASDLSDGAQLMRILDDNGAPTNDRHLVLGSAAMANIRGKQAVLFRVNEAGTDQLLRQGIIGELQGMNLHYSGQVKSVTKGTGSAYVTSGSTAPGVAAIALITGSGTVLAGDVVTFAADTNNKYVVNVGVAAPGTITLGKPGAIITIPSGNALTIGNNYTANMGFSRNAIHLVTRAPAMPDGGDMADDVTEIVDPVSGLAFQVAMYRQYRQVRFEVGLAWGFKVAKQEHLAILMG